MGTLKSLVAHLGFLAILTLTLEAGTSRSGPEDFLREVEPHDDDVSSHAEDGILARIEAFYEKYRGFQRTDKCFLCHEEFGGDIPRIACDTCIPGVCEREECTTMYQSRMTRCSLCRNELGSNYAPVTNRALRAIMHVRPQCIRTYLAAKCITLLVRMRTYVSVQDGFYVPTSAGRSGRS
jgi:hypothetical protein